VAVIGPTPGNGHQPPHDQVRFGAPNNLGVEPGDLLIQGPQGGDQHAQDGAGALRQELAGSFDPLDQPGHMRHALGNHPAVFGEMAAQRIDALSSLAHQKITRAENHGAGLLLLALHRHEPHAGALGCLADRLGVGRIVLVSLDEWLDVGWRNQPDNVAELGELAPPIMRASAGFHRDQARRVGREKSEQPRRVGEP